MYTVEKIEQTNVLKKADEVSMRKAQLFSEYNDVNITCSIKMKES